MPSSCQPQRLDHRLYRGPELYQRRLAHRKTQVADTQELAGHLPADTVVIMQLFENIAHHAVTAEYTNIPCRKDPPGTYHVDGDLLIAPPEKLEPC